MRRVESSSMGRPAPPSRTETNTSGSVVRYSFFNSASRRAQTALISRASAAATTAEASRGMALSFRPPLTDTSRNAVSRPQAVSTRPSSMQALPRPLSISTPEGPPRRPPTVTVRNSAPKVSRQTGRVHFVRLPPAQLTVNTPSTSESRFSIRRPRSMDTSSMPTAPSMPISSSTVNTASSRG